MTPEYCPTTSRGRFPAARRLAMNDGASIAAAAAHGAEMEAARAGVHGRVFEVAQAAAMRPAMPANAAAAGHLDDRALRGGAERRNRRSLRGYRAGQSEAGGESQRENSLHGRPPSVNDSACLAKSRKTDRNLTTLQKK